MTDHTKEGLLLFSYECDDLGVDLACWFEYEPAEVGYRTRFGEQLEPDYPATWSLHHVYLPGSAVDIAPVMNPAWSRRLKSGLLARRMRIGSAGMTSKRDY